MRKMIVATLIGGLMLASGCTNGRDFWGNPAPSAAEPEACAAADVASPPDMAFDPNSQTRPPDVLPGNSWVVIGLAVRALPPDPAMRVGRDYCVPVAIHTYTRPGEADTVSVNSFGFEPGPFDFTVNTPWTGRYLALQYDPLDERFAGRPPTYEIHLQAKYASAPFGSFDRASADAVAPRALACSLYIWGGLVATDVAILPDRDSVSCTFTGNTFHLY